MPEQLALDQPAEMALQFTTSGVAAAAVVDRAGDQPCPSRSRRE
jgi:hypothetical protein